MKKDLNKNTFTPDMDYDNLSFDEFFKKYNFNIRKGVAL